MLVELSNAAPNDPAQKQVNISAEQRRAEDLLKKPAVSANSAARRDAGLAGVFGRTGARALGRGAQPGRGNAGAAQAIQRKIEERGILFKVRVVNKELQQRQEHEACAGAERIHEKRKEQSMTIGQFIEQTALCGSPRRRCWQRHTRRGHISVSEPMRSGVTTTPVIFSDA